jgi:hypothetical protein
MIELQAENETVPYQPRPPGPLVTIGGVRKELAAVYRDARLNKITPGTATKLCFILGTLARVIQGDELERRLDELEKQIAAPGRVIYAEFSEENGGH